MKGSNARPGRRFWGKLNPEALVGREKWMDHDASRGWDDGGVAQSIGQDVTNRTRQAITEQVREAVAEYAADSEFALTVTNGKLMVAVRYSNPAAALIAEVPLVELINASVRDAYGAAAHPQAQELLTALMTFAASAAKLRQSMQQPQPPPIGHNQRAAVA